MRSRKHFLALDISLTVRDVLPPRAENLGPSRRLHAKSSKHGWVDLVDLNDAIGRNVGAPRGLANGLRVRRLVKAIGLSLVGAEKREYPFHSDIIIDPLDAGGRLLGDLKSVGELTFDDEPRHLAAPLTQLAVSHRTAKRCQCS